MNWSPSFADKPAWKTTIIFLVLSWLGILFVFRGAVWGDRILSPLDIPATMYSKYKWIDPTAGNIPRNHYLLDMFDYELERVYMAHRSLHAGIFPWWDPYSDGGGPVAAETHYGLTDPSRLLLFKTLPFVTAYNWSRILESFLSGLGMFFLLRFLGFSQFAMLLGALSFQFAALQSSFFYSVPPHSLPYYCFLWLALAKHTRTRPFFAIGLGGPLCAAIIMSGTQQSHAYLVLFLACLAAGYGSCFRNDILKIASVAAGVFALGCALAAPLLIPQIELFLLSSREVSADTRPIQFLTGLFQVTNIFPWFTGSFRTLEVSKILSPGQPGLGYVLYIGTAALSVSVVAMLSGRKSFGAANPHVRTSFLLIMVYLVAICSTPLLNLLYNRSGALAVIGLTVMFATGWDLLIKSHWATGAKIVRWLVLILAVGIVALHGFALLVYPRIKDRVLDAVLRREAQNPSMPPIPHIRRFQIDNFPNEVTFRNPEPLLAFLGALCLLGLVRTDSRHRHIFASGVLAFNLLPLLLFSSRAIPSSPVAYWHALLAGGPEQKKVMNELGRDLRLKEIVPDRLDYVLPGTLAGLYQVHSVHGYVGLRPGGAAQTERLRQHNVLYQSDWRQPSGQITVVNTNQVRFVWADKQNRKVTIIDESANSIRLRIEPGPPGELVRTDTYYPGWRVETPRSVQQRQNPDGFLAFSIPPQSIDLVLRYAPSYHHLTMPLSLVSLLVTTGLLFWGRPRVLTPDAIKTSHYDSVLRT